VLEGSVQRAGQRLHVTAQLLRADTGYHLWSQTYDRAVDDIFAVQDEVSTAVAKALKVSLSPASQSTVGGTRNAEANDLYLEARFNAGQLSSEGASTASGLLARALTLDPNFAAAWALLSRVRMSQFRHRLVPAAQLEATRGLAREAAQRAVALAPDLPEAHLALGRVFFFEYVYLYKEEQVAHAAAQFQRALELDPHNADAMVQLGMVAARDGRLNESIGLQRQALQLDPLDLNILELLGDSYIRVGKPAPAEPLLRKELELSRNSMYASDSLATALTMLDRAPEALSVIEKTDRQDQLRNWWRVLLYPALGRGAEADKLLASLERNPGTIDPIEIAELYAYRGDKDRAFFWLERQFRKDPLLLRERIPWAPFMESLRDDPGYNAVLRDVQLLK
jgi:tetratricopeptide (TPR) repeat protein